jgi:hypothetical protein
VLIFGETGTKHSKAPDIAAIGASGWSPLNPWHQISSMGASGFEQPTSQALVRLQQVTATGQAPALPCAALFCSWRLATHSTDVFVFVYGFGENDVTPNFTWRRNLAFAILPS